MLLQFYQWLKYQLIKLQGLCVQWQNQRERIYVRGEFKESLGMNFLSPFQGSSKCTNHVNVHKLYAVEYSITVCSLFYSILFYSISISNFLKLLNKLYNKLSEEKTSFDL